MVIHDLYDLGTPRELGKPLEYIISISNINDL
jgi:hypothetical protein